MTDKGDRPEGTGGTPVSHSCPWRNGLLVLMVFIVGAGGLVAAEPLLRAVDLEIGESAEVELSDGSSAQVKLVAVDETRDPSGDD